MVVVTLNGQIGAGGPEVGLRVSHILKADYVDRLILAEAAKRIGATVQAVVGKEQEVLRFKDRISRFLQNMLERSAMSGVGGEPYFGPGIDVILSRDYQEQLEEEPITHSHELDDKRFIEVTSAVIKDLAQGGNVVIVGRGGNIILKDTPNVLHVDVIAPKDHRIRTIMEREHLEANEAEKFVDHQEEARNAFFNRFFKANPLDATLYHMILNMADLRLDTAAQIVAHAAQDLDR